MNNHTIQCPKCGNNINVEEILEHQLEEKLRQEYQHKYNQDILKFNEEKEKLAQSQREFEFKKSQENELFRKKLEEQLTLQVAAKEKQIREANAQNILALEKKAESAEVEKIRVQKLELKLQDQEKLIRERMDLEFQQKLSESQNQLSEKIRKQEQERNELEKKELLKQLEDQKKLTQEMQRKQEQGSMQLQGEVQELAIEEWLRHNFPLDTIQEIKKGVKGADCIQVVHTRIKENCGTIYYESKRTKDFQKGWIEKFKIDIREQNATIGILVTEVMPAGMDRMGLREGVWICNFEEFKGLCFVMRENIIALDQAISTQENKGDKMTMLYDFLTSNEFKGQVEGIIEGYTQMHADLISEKRSIEGHWKKREKQLQKVLLNTSFMYNSLKGIAGNAIQSIKTLELPESNHDEANYNESDEE